MVTKYIPSTTNAILVGDKGANGATPKPTKVGANLCNAILELQSTTRAFLPPQMTTAQRNAIPNLVNGMEVFDTTLQTKVVYQGNAWVAMSPVVLPTFVSGVLTAAQMNGAFTLGVPLIPAAGANRAIIVSGFSLELISDGTAFTGGGAIKLQFDTTLNAGGIGVSGTIPSTFLTGAGTDRLTYVSGAFTAAAVVNYVNTPVCIANAGAVFAAGGASTLNWGIWYSVLTTTGT